MSVRPESGRDVLGISVTGLAGVQMTRLAMRSRPSCPN
jgi:hypothetical protein